MDRAQVGFPRGDANMDLPRIAILLMLAATCCASCGDTHDAVIPLVPTVEATDFMPAWSPVSGSIVFVHKGRDTGWRSTIWILNPEGTEATPMVEGVQPNWSPEGDKIAYSWEVSARWHDLAAETTRVLPGGDWLFEPDWSPDGSKIAWCWEGGSSEIRIMDVENLQCRRLGLGCSPDWSPDGSEILFLDGGLCIMDSSGTNRRQVAISDSTSGSLVPDEAEWCPNGNSIVFSSFYFRLWLVSADGTGLKSLGRGMNPSWSPDGEQIVFADQGLEGSENNVRLWIMNADGTGRRQLTFPETTRSTED